ncbi:MAG: hypothetical protein ACE366_12695 [Bradymonadia bacterium]
MRYLTPTARRLSTLLTGALMLNVFAIGGCAEGEIQPEGDIPPPSAFSPYTGPTSGQQDIKGDGDNEVDPGSEGGDELLPGPEANPGNTQGFSIYFETPTRGEWIENQQIIHAIGRVVGGKARSVTVGGQPVTTSSDGSFSVELAVIPGLNILTAAAVSEDGEEVETRQGLMVDAREDPSRTVEHAVAVQMGPSSLAGLNDMVAEGLDGLDMDSLLAGGGSGNIQVTRANYGNMTAQLFPAEGHLNIRLGINGVSLYIAGSMDILGNVTPVSGVVRIGTLEINAQVAVEADGAGGVALDMNGGTVNLRNFDYDLDNTPGFIEGIFQGMVEDMVRDEVEKAMADVQLPPFLGADDLSSNMDILGTVLEMGLAIQEVEVRTAGLQLWLSGRTRAQNPRHQGYVLSSPSTQASLDAGASMDLALSEAFTSRLLFAAWSAGGLDFVIAPGDASAGIELKVGLLKSALGPGAENIDPDTPVTLQVRSLYPPVVKMGNGEKPLGIQMSDMLLAFSANGRPMFTSVIHLDMHVGLSANEDGSLKAELDVDAFTEILDTPIGEVDKGRLATLIGAVARTMPEGLIGGLFEGGLTGSLPIKLDGFRTAKMEPDPSVPGWAHIKGY